MKLNKLSLIIAVAALACGAMAQGGGGGGRRGGGQRGGGGAQYSAMALIRNEDVQKELSITDDQKTKITDLLSSVRQKSTDAVAAAGDDRAAQGAARAKVNADAAKDLAVILTPDQVKRLRELQLQWTGPSIVATDKELQGSLGITEDQIAKIKDLQQKEQAANAEVRTSANGDRQAMQEGFQKNAKILADEIAKVLTDDQKSKLAAMSGKPLAKPASLTQGRRGGGGN